MRDSQQIWKMLEEHDMTKAIIAGFEDAAEKAVEASGPLGVVAGLAAMAVLCQRHGDMMAEASHDVPADLATPLDQTAQAFVQAYALASAGAITMAENMAAFAMAAGGHPMPEHLS